MVVHCRGPYTASLALALKERFPDWRVLFDMRGLGWAEEALIHQSRDPVNVPHDLDGSSRRSFDLEKAVAKAADAMICVSHAMRDWVVDHFDVGPSKIHVIVNPADATIAIGAYSRVDGTDTVTLTMPAAHTYRPGDKFTLTTQGGDVANIPNVANQVVVSVTSTTVVYTDTTAADYVNVATIAMTSGSKNVQLAVDLPSEAAAGEFVQLYRTFDVSGTSTDRNTIISSTKLSPTTAPTNSGSRLATLSDRSMNTAVSPPT